MDKLREEVQAILSEILDEQKQSEFGGRLEAALLGYKNEIEEMISENNAKSEALASKEEEIVSKNSELEEIQNKLETLTASYEELKKEKEVLSKKLEDISKDNTAHERVRKLIEAKLIANDEDTINKYFKKIRDKEKADFEAYIEELTEIRDTLVKELENKKVEEEKEKAKLEENREKEKDEKNKIFSNPTLAALNFELQPSNDIVNKYKKMWETEEK